MYGMVLYEDRTERSYGLVYIPLFFERERIEQLHGSEPYNDELVSVRLPSRCCTRGSPMVLRNKQPLQLERILGYDGNVHRPYTPNVREHQ